MCFFLCQLVAKMVATRDGYTQYQVNQKKMVNDLKFKANMAEREKKATQNALGEVTAARDEAISQVAFLELEHQNALYPAISKVEVQLGQALSNREALLKELAEAKI